MSRALRVLAMSALCGAPLAYVYFSTVLPNATFPTYVRLSFLVPVLVTAGLGVLAGTALERMDEVIITAFGSSIFGTLYLSAMLFYPTTLPQIDSTQLEDLLLNVVNRAFPIMLLCFVVFVISSFLGQYYADEPGDKDFFEKKPWERERERQKAPK